MSHVHSVFDSIALGRHRHRAVRLHRADPASTPDFLLRRVADDFADRLAFIKRRFTDAVDLGCHHGALGRTLCAAGAVTAISSTDACRAMLDLAPLPHALVDLEHLPFRQASLDLVVSGLALQTVDDLPGTLAQIRAALRPDGLLLAAVIGGRSLFELRDAFLTAETEMTGGASPRVAPMIDVRDLGTLLQRAQFALPVVDSDVVTVTYDHPLRLMHDLRGMGATNCLRERSRSPLSRAALSRACEIYRERYAEPDGRVRATFEILTATAWSPHESQQKPLKPGSAATRLADALQPPPTR